MCWLRPRPGFGKSHSCLHKLAGIEDVLRVEGALHDAMEFTRFRGNRLRPPAFLRQTDAVFAADGAANSNYPAEQFVERGFGAAFGARLCVVHHYVGVHVAVAGMAETRD